MASYIRLPLIYFCVSALWIAFSDIALSLFLKSSPELLSTAQLYKGQFFIILTTALLYLLLRREFRQRQAIHLESENRDENFRYIFLNNPRPMWIYDAETLAFLEVNEMAVAEYGYSRDAFLSMTLKDISPKEDAARLLTSLTSEESALRHNGHWRHVRKNGSIIDVDIVSHLLTFKGRKAALVVIDNITERNRMERELKRTNETLRTLIAESPLGVIASDSEGIVTIWNPAAERIFGWKAAETIGRAAPITPDDKQLFTQQLRRSVMEGESFTDIEIRRLHKNGDMIDVSLSVAPLRDMEGEINGMMAVYADISERKQLQRELSEKEHLRLALDKEIELRQLRDQFTSMMSHEFRNPLTTIFTSTDMLDHYHERMTPEMRRQKFEDIRGQIRRLVEMLDDILVVMRSQSIGLQFAPKLIDIIVLTQQLIAEAQMNAGQEHAIHFKSSHAQAVIEGDEKLLRHAINNLLSNAAKYSPEGKHIDVKLKVTEHEVIIEVVDHGIGIPQDDVEKLSEAFFRASNVGAIPGTGLGLAITKQAIELHNGQFNISSQVGVGSTFSITLPRTQTHSTN